jgi:hypothetical protein
MISKTKIEFTILLILLIFYIPAVKSLFAPGGYTSHDMTHHVIRQINMDQLLSEGQFPPRWSGDLNKGFGYPVFLFNYPLPSLLGEIFVKLDFGYVASVKVILFLSLIVSGLGMYLFLKSLLNSRLSAFLGAVFFVYAPIRFVLVYVSAAVGAALALAFIPFIFWAITILKDKPKSGILIGSLSLAGLILSHNVMTLIFMPAIFGFGILKAWNNLKKFVVMVGMGFGLSAWFWIPATIEKQYIKYDLIFDRFYADHFPSFFQLLRSPWGYGLDNIGSDRDGMSFQIGLIQILVMLILMSVWWFLKSKKEIKVTGSFSTLLFLGSIFLALKISLPFWDSLPLLKYVQFPWRFLTLATFASAIAAALLIKYLPLKKIPFVILLVLVLYANRNHLRINEVFNPGESYYLNQKPTTASFDEHAPLWALPPKEQSISKLEFLTGSGKIKYIENKSSKVKVEIETKNQAKLVFNQFYFPGWQLFLDDKAVNFNYQTNDLNQGLPVFEISEGKHLFLAEFKNTWDRNLGDFISLGSTAIWFGLLLYIKKGVRN